MCVKSLLSQAFIWSEIQWEQKYCEILLQLFCDCEYTAIIKVFSVTWSFRNHFNMLCSKNDGVYIVLPNIFYANCDTFFPFGFCDESKVQNSISNFKTAIFCNIINVFKCHSPKVVFFFFFFKKCILYMNIRWLTKHACDRNTHNWKQTQKTK